MRIAIVGFGPRGLGALEALVGQWRKGALSVDIFEPGPYPAAGPNFSPDEQPGCLLNLPLRDVNLPSPETFDFPEFAQWTSEPDENRFLPRAVLGRYLTARFKQLQAALPDRIQVTVHAKRVIAQTRGDDGKLCLETGNAQMNGYDAVLLTVGQPETAPDPQLERWRDHAAQHGLTCLDAYPTEHVVDAADNWGDKIVAIRGLGLSTLDVLSLLTTGRGGNLRDGRYHPSGEEPGCILPFSLDGMAPAPKPATAELAARFCPLPTETDAFRSALKGALSGEDAATSKRLLAIALKTPVTRISGKDATPWLETELSDPGTQRGQDPVAALHNDIAIATGALPPSVGYAAGQVWRAWQRPLRKIFRTSDASPLTRLAFVDFDTALKRYSYGPPVSDAFLLAALIEAELVRLTVADDPDISLSPEGWVLDDERTAHVMINAVLAPASLSMIREPVIEKLKAEDTLGSVNERGGARTLPNGQVVAVGGKAVPGLALLGRLAEGSVIAADSIHDCFGGTSQDWAASIVHSWGGN
jgi:uncharacterized NAD(P)/FAD-binding protein YdhS